MARINPVLFILLRLIVYGVLMAGLYYVYSFDAHHHSGSAKFGEDSLTEILQEVFLFLISGIFFMAGIRNKEFRPFTHLLACFFLVSFIRELNFLIDHWFYFVSVVLVIAVFLFIRDFHKIWPAFINFFSLSASAYFLIGFISTYIFSRLYGKAALWKAIMEESYVRQAKAASEECIELLGYTFLLVSAIEFFIAVYRKRQTNN